MRFIFSLICFICLNAVAQKNFTIAEAISTTAIDGKTSLAPSKLNQLQFTKAEGQLSFILNDEQLMGVDKNGKVSTTVSLDKLNDAFKKTGLTPLKKFPSVKWINDNSFSFTAEKRMFTYSLNSGAVNEIKDAESTQAALEHADYAPDGKTVAFTRNYNLYVKINGQEKAVSTDGTFDIVYGYSAHRDEFGISKGTYFSPNSNFLAFYKMDQTMVTNYPIINWGEKVAKANNIKYPFAGNASHHVTLGIYNLKTGLTHYVKTTGDPEQYLTNITWSPDETKIYIAIVNRAQNHMWLNEYDASTGNFLKTLFEEKDDKFLEPMNPMVFTANGKQFIWESNRDGYKHLYLYDNSGKQIKQLTSGKWEVKQHNGFDAKSENYFFHANVSSPVNQEFCMVNITTGKMKVLTSGTGFHKVTLNASRTYGIDYFSNITTPGNVSLINIKNKTSVTFHAAANPLEGYNIGKLKLFTIKNTEGTDLHCRMFYPHDFDSTKKYPVVVYLYNGPHVQLVTNTWLAGADLWYHYMAQHGYIVFTLDGRGSANRGKVFEQAIHRQLGKLEMEDQLSGVNYLKGLRYVDGARLGVHGWSYGGFMTTSLMTRHAGVFKAGVCGGPVIDWSMYEIMYGERYMDTPQENKEGYEANNLLNHIDKLKDKLLVIHGTDDDVVVWQHSIMLLRKSVEKGVQIDYNVYPGHPHNVRGKDRIHLMDKISRYFFENL